MTSDRARPLLLAALAGALFLIAWICLLFTRQAGTVAAVWPVNALVAAVLVRWARGPGEQAAVVGLAGAALFAANVAWGSSVLLAMILVILNLIEIAAAAWMVRRAGSPVDSPRALMAFVAGPVLAVPVLAAAFATGAMLTIEPVPEPLRVFMRWWCADALGMAIVGSFALTVGRAGGLAASPRQWARFALAQGLVLVASVYIMIIAPVPPLFLLFPFLMMGALSHREIGGVTSVALVAAVAVAATFNHHGPAEVADIAKVERTQLMQVFLGALALTALPVSALLRRLDLTARELEEKRAAAVALDAAKTKLLSYVSHEIRSPLSGVTSLAQMMRDGALGELTPEQRETLAQIAASGAQVDQLASDLTDVAAMRAGKTPVSIVPVPVGDAIKSALGVARFRAIPYGCTFEHAATAADGLVVAADPMRLRQILVNLLVNGAKYGGRPPLVRIRARLSPEGAVRFEVCDNGPGLPEDRREGLFQDFQMLGAEGSSIEGVGLGLALSSEMARVQHGSLGVGDGELGGALFWLELPLAREPAGAAAA